MEQDKTITDWIKAIGDGGLKSLETSVLAGARSFNTFTEAGAARWLFIEPIVSTGWMLGVVYDTSHLPRLDQLQQSKLLVSVAGLLALLSSIGLWLSRERKEQTALAGAAE